MDTLVLILTCLTLGCILWQDLKYRAVSWLLFPIAFFSLGVYYLLIDHLTWLNMLPNMLFLTATIGGVFLYFQIKKISFKAVLQEYIALGDLLFFIGLAITMTFPVFPIFFITTLILSLLTGLLFFRGNTIPLAGLQALFTILFLIPTHVYPQLINLETVWL